MTIIRSYAIRAIDEEPGDASPLPAGARRRFDYAALIRRARAGVREPQGRPNPTFDPNEASSSAEGSRTAAGSMPTMDADQGDCPGLAQQRGERKRSSLSEHTQSDAIEPHTLIAAESLEQHLQRLDAPYLDALTRDHHAGFALLDYLTARVADFCTDPAVLAQGHWTMRLTLDPAILPDCTLSLTLSYFDLTLRFDSRDSTSRQLVLHHADVLKQRLEALLEQHDAPRTVEILAD